MILGKNINHASKNNHFTNSSIWKKNVDIRPNKAEQQGSRPAAYSHIKTSCTIANVVAILFLEKKCVCLYVHKNPEGTGSRYLWDIAEIFYF